MIQASLNDEGMKIWSKIFPDGKIPITAPHSRIVDLGGIPGEAYFVAWDLLTPDQRRQVINHLAERFHAPVQDVEQHILKDGLPLRADLVSHVIIPDAMRYI